MKDKKIKTNDEEIVKTENIKKSKKVYIDYIGRVLISGVAFLVLILSSLLLFYKSFEFQDEKTINYQEKGNLNYKVYLKPNKYFDVPYLEQGKLYIASIIKSINIDFNYSFLIENKMNINSNYSIVAKLSINDSSSKKTFYEKEYTLLEPKTTKYENRNSYNFKETISIDYDYYNALANDFKSTYGVDATSTLTVYLKVNSGLNKQEENINRQERSEMSITIPLSQRQLDIQIGNTEINEMNKIVTNSKVVLSNVVFMVIAAVLFILSVATVLKFLELLFMLRTKKSNYDKFIKKTLSEYDRLIVETPTIPNFDDKNIIKIKRFEELLDVRDTLKQPIMYCNVISHQKSYFYIKHDDSVYLMIVKAVDLDEKKK